MIIFIDTSAFYALLDGDDENYPKARQEWIVLLKDENLFITSNYVIVETFSLLQHRIGIEATRGFQEDLLPMIQVEFVTLEMHRSGVIALFTASRRNLSLVDCVSFEMMRTLEIRTAFTFDPHFEKQGFRRIP